MAAKCVITMQSIFASDGLAAGAIGNLLGLFCFGFSLIVLAIWFAIQRRSRLAALLGILTWIVLTGYVRPWLFFFPFPSDDIRNESSGDLGIAFALSWLFASIGLIVIGIRAMISRVKSDRPIKPMIHI